jgi:hypothetical protein
MLTHSAPSSRIIRQLFDVREGQNEMYGGSSDTDVTDWHVKPYGRTPSLAVITAMPVQNRPRTSRMDVGVGAQLVIGLLALCLEISLNRRVADPQQSLPASGERRLSL